MHVQTMSLYNFCFYNNASIVVSSFFFSQLVMKRKMFVNNISSLMPIRPRGYKTTCIYAQLS